MASLRYQGTIDRAGNVHVEGREVSAERTANAEAGFREVPGIF